MDYAVQLCNIFSRTEMPALFPTAAEKYQSFLDSVRDGGAGIVSESSGSEMPTQSEMEIQARWFGGEFGRNFTGTNGETIEIVQFGHWNHSAGPDFTDVAIRVNGELKTGAIEIDLDALSWEAHGHGASGSFDSTVLHVFLQTSKSPNRFFTRNSKHLEICQLQLSQVQAGENSPRWLPEAYPGRCVTPLAQMESSAVFSLLTAAAQYRLLGKFLRFRAMADATSTSQAMFQGVAEALGFRHNKVPMAILAQRCPIQVLGKMDNLAREARIFGAAGFMEQEIYAETISPDSREYLRGLWSEWWKMRTEIEPSPDRVIRWKTGGSRPVNHPQRRVGALGAITNKWKSLARVWENPSPQCEKSLYRFFEALTQPYWEQHYTLLSQPSARPLRLIGKDRQRDILGNVIFPWLVGNRPDYWEAYSAMRGSGGNEKLRRATLRLFGNDEARTKEYSKAYFQQQGLLQIYQDFCLEDSSDCADCPFPEQVLQWQE